MFLLKSNVKYFLHYIYYAKTFVYVVVPSIINENVLLGHLENHLSY